jgi:N-acetylmuramoyl-L-alanine amidase
MKILKFSLLFTSYCLLVTVFCGCVTTAPRKEAFSTYTIHGARYLSLVSLCDARGVDWRYDTYTRRVHLNNDAHQVNLMAGDSLVTLDGKVMRLDRPVEIHNGTVAVPYKFKKLIFDPVFKEVLAARPGEPYVLNITKIVIDAGHGGKDPGAIGRSGLKEKDINLDVAKRLSKILSSRGIEVVMTRTTDVFIPLSRRVDIANSSGASLFISIHSNANRVRSLHGFEVYYVSPSVEDTKRALASAKSVPFDLTGGSLVSSSLDVKAILWDMFYTDSRAESVALSRSLRWTVEKNLEAKFLGIKGARFEVLRGVRMPAVLVEVGFLSNSAEERMLKNSFYRHRVAESLMQGIEDYARTVPPMEVAKR